MTKEIGGWLLSVANKPSRILSRGLLNDMINTAIRRKQIPGEILIEAQGWHIAPSQPLSDDLHPGSVGFPGETAKQAGRTRHQSRRTAGLDGGRLWIIWTTSRTTTARGNTPMINAML